jgi:hypothetical protein
MSRMISLVLHPRQVLRESKAQDLAIDVLPPQDQLWIIAQAVEENGGPSDYVGVLRQLAERLEDTGWWLREPAKVGP